jgi:hypothetical protein
VDPVDGALIRLFADPAVTLRFQRDRVSMIESSASESCESWMEALGRMYTPVQPGYLSGSWHPTAVTSTSASFSLVIACLPRRDGGNLMAEITYGGDTRDAGFAPAVSPLLAAVGAALGVAPAVTATTDPGYYTPPPASDPYAPTDDGGPSRPRRSPYQAFSAPGLLVSYAGLTPAALGAERIVGATVALDLLVVPRDRRREVKIVNDVLFSAGYHGDAGWSAEGRSGVGYQIGSPRTALIPVLGLGLDLIDHGADDAPFHAYLAGYAYAGAIVRVGLGDNLVVEGRAAAIKRAGVLDETQVSARAILLRGHRRRLSVDLGWRGYDHDSDDAMGAEMVTFGVGIGG